MLYGHITINRHGCQACLAVDDADYRDHFQDDPDQSGAGYVEVEMVAWLDAIHGLRDYITPAALVALATEPPDEYGEEVETE